MMRLSFDNKVVLVKMYPNITGNALLKLLPLMVDFEELGSVEKVGYLQADLLVDEGSKGLTPRAGDVTYYYPWGNLAFFYKDSDYSPGLVKIGTIQSGLEELARAKGVFKAKLEKVK